MAKPTYRDIADAAGVGTATVERVLNGRGGVRPATAARVATAARKLDWPGRLPEAHRGLIRLEVMLVRPRNSFFARLGRAFRRVSATLDPAIQVQVAFVDETDPEGVAARIADPQALRAALAVAIPGHPAIGAALARRRDDGLPVVELVTGAFGGASYIGIDNRAAGRTGAMLMSRIVRRDGPVAGLCHSGIYLDQRARIEGFTGYLADKAPGLRFVHLGLGRDDPEASAAVVRDALRRWPDLVGFYNAGGGNSGALAELAKAREAGRDVFFVGHELSDHAADALRSGVADIVIDQAPEAQARRTVDVLLSQLGLTDEPVANPPIRFVTATSENV